MSIETELREVMALGQSLNAIDSVPEQEFAWQEARREFRRKAGARYGARVKP